jgi:hypothetical protein
MTRQRLIIIGAIVLLFFGMGITINIQIKSIKRLRADNIRMNQNIDQLMQDNAQQTALVLTEREVTGKIKRERDSLAKALQIRPKQIEKIVYIDNSTHDTIRINVPSIITGQDAWKIQDSTKCFKWAANALKQGDELKITRTLFEYDNRITQTFYRKRPYKFLFVKYGKWQNLQRIESECGENTVKQFTFIK